jgi:hypothetical protein
MRQLKAAYSIVHPQHDETSPSALRHALHQVLWLRKKPLQCPNVHGHNYKIVDWSYDNVSLCRNGFMRIFGGTYESHRQVYSLVLRGVSPTDASSEKGASLLAKTEARIQGQLSTRQTYATVWLSRSYLNTMEFMPNERRIVLRGVGLLKVHKALYAPCAAPLGLKLSYRQFANCLPAAAVICARDVHGEKDEDATKVRVGRSARHSKFPKCSACVDAQNHYIQVASNPLASPAEVEQAFSKWIAHQKEFMDDRHAAMRLRHGTYLADATTCYECDDKCGSHWCRCPVPRGGRDSKFTATRNYEFAVQANVICGPGGVMRMSIIPKTVSTGANFGLSTLLQGLWSACRVKDGVATLSQSVGQLLRHTDGGPDNVASLTHIFHWLLVYVGCWQDLIWFMFKAGHSHTEIADRLFGLMKKLFETDHNTHVEGGIQSFEQLEDELKKCFSNCPEMKEIVYHFANWDLNKWLKGTVNFHPGDLKHISKNMVYRYTYVGNEPCVTSNGVKTNMAALHGGVRVTFKDRLSQGAPSPMDDEYGPLLAVEEETAAGETVHANRTDNKGVVFVKTPPNLTSEPEREDLAPK